MLKGQEYRRNFKQSKLKGRIPMVDPVHTPGSRKNRFEDTIK